MAAFYARFRLMPVFTRASRLRTRGGRRDDKRRTKRDGGAGGSCGHDGGGTGKRPGRADRRARPAGRDHRVARHQLRGSVARRPGRGQRSRRDDLRAHRRAHRVGRWRGKSRSNARTAGATSAFCCSRATWPKRKSQRHGIKDGVLGQAHLSSGRADIFCDRIATMPGAPKISSRTRSATSSPTKWAISCWVRIAIPAAASCARTSTCAPFTSRVLTRRRPTPSVRH